MKLFQLHHLLLPLLILYIYRICLIKQIILSKESEWSCICVLSVSDEGYSRNASCAVNLISTFLLEVSISFYDFDFGIMWYFLFFILIQEIYKDTSTSLISMMNIILTVFFYFPVILTPY
jgi:hypothetical protein